MKPNPISSVAITVVLAMLPQVAKAGPCASDIAELETTLQQPGIEAVGAPSQLSIAAEPGLRSTSGVAGQTGEHWWPQFSATIARAKRLDVYGDRLGCTGALNAARGMFVLVERE
jgi:hypothetical protein